MSADLSDRPRSFLFLQGPLAPLYARLAGQLEAAGHRVSRINLCPGDWLHWRRPGAIDYRGTPADWPEFVRREMAARAVTDVILHGDRRPYHAAAIIAAHKRGARVYVTELGYLRPDWMTLERDATGGASHFSRDPAVIEWLAVQSRPLDLVPRYQAEFAKVAIPDVIYNLSNTLLRVLYPHYQRHTIYFPPLEYAAWLVRLATRPLRDRAAASIAQEIAQHDRVSFLFGLQLEGDYQIRSAARDGLTGALGNKCRGDTECVARPLPPTVSSSGSSRGPMLPRVRKIVRLAGAPHTTSTESATLVESWVLGPSPRMTLNGRFAPGLSRRQH